jgi:clathrin heavy chain
LIYSPEDPWLSVAFQIATLEKEVKEQTKKTQTREQQEADQPIINPGGFGNQRMITAGPG